MRAFGSLVAASIGAICFSNAADDLASALTHIDSSPAFLSFAVFLAIAVIAFVFALRSRGPTWAIVLPNGAFTVLAGFLAVISGDSQHWIIAASTLALTMVVGLVSVWTRPRSLVDYD